MRTPARSRSYSFMLSFSFPGQFTWNAWSKFEPIFSLDQGEGYPEIPMASSSTADSDDVDRLVRLERQKLEELLNTREMQRGTYPAFAVSARGQKVWLILYDRFISMLTDFPLDSYLVLLSHSSVALKVFRKDLLPSAADIFLSFAFLPYEAHQNEIPLLINW